MPIFPINPTDQQEETLGSRVFRYDAASGRWRVFRAPSTGSAAITQTDLDEAVANVDVTDQVNAIIDAAPEALDTLDELAAALNDDANFATTVTNQLATKANSADLATVATSGSYTDLSNQPTIPTAVSELTNDTGFITSVDYSEVQNTPTIPSDVSDLTDNNELLGSGGGTVVYATSADLPLTGNSGGDIAYVTETERLYVFIGTGWYNIGTVNTAPTITQGAEATYDLSQFGTPTVITLSATDPEDVPITWSYAITSGELGTTATISQNDNEFTITPSTDTADNGTFEITFTASDGVNIDTSVASITLAISSAFKFSGSAWQNNTINIFDIDGEIASGYGGGTANSSTVFDTCYIVQPTGHTGYSYLYVPAPYDVGYTIYRGYGTDANIYANKKYTKLGATTHNKDFCVSPTNEHILTSYSGSFFLYPNDDSRWVSYTYGTPSGATQQTLIGQFSTPTSTYGDQPYWAQNNSIYSTKNGSPGKLYCHSLGGTLASPSASITYQWEITLPAGVTSPGRPFVSNDGAYCIVGCMSTGKVVTLAGQSAFDFRNYTLADEVTITETSQGRNRFGGIFGSHDGIHFLIASFNYNNQGSNPATNGYIHRWRMAD